MPYQPNELENGSVVAEEEAVPVQGFGLVAAWTALLLEGKS